MDIHGYPYPWISMDIHRKSVDMDMDMDVKFHIHGNPGELYCSRRTCEYGLSVSDDGRVSTDDTPPHRPTGPRSMGPKVWALSSLSCILCCLYDVYDGGRQYLVVVGYLQSVPPVIADIFQQDYISVEGRPPARIFNYARVTLTLIYDLDLDKLKMHDAHQNEISVSMISHVKSRNTTDVQM